MDKNQSVFLGNSVTRIFILLGLAGLSLSLSAEPEQIASTEAQAPEAQRLQFHLPPGFEIQLVLSDPDIGQPMNLSFDAQGRLWVTSSVEYPYPAQVQGLDPRIEKMEGVSHHRPQDWLTVASGIGADGKPAKIERFAKGLNIPIGQTPLGDGNSGIIYSIPDISLFRDEDGDGVAEVRETLYNHFGNIDTHGMANSFRRWIDGWIYGCHGFRNTSQVVDNQGRSTELYSGHTYRFQPDGSKFEIYTRGQVNPFGLTIDPLGNIYSADCHSRPLYQLLQGAAYLRPSWGEPIQEPLGLAPEMIDHDHGSTGICGPAYYAADYFPAEYRDNIFLCNPVTGRIHRDKLVDYGSTRIADTQPDFISCDDPWFRPVDMTVGPDGAVYIADFYNAIIGHYEVPLDHEKRDRTRGRVWRVIYKAPPQPVPNLTELEPKQLIQVLETDNEALRVLANNQLVDNWEPGDEAIVRELRNETTPNARAHLLWVLERQDALIDADLDAAVNDESHIVQVHAQKIISERSFWDTQEQSRALTGLRAANAFVQRAAADGMRRHPDPMFIDPLLEAWKQTDEKDTHLVHVLRMALREQLIISEDWSAGRPEDDRLVDVASATESAESAKYVLLVSDPTQATFKDALDLNAGLLNQEELRRLVDRLANTPLDKEQSIKVLASLIIGMAYDPSSELVQWASELIQVILKDTKSVERPVVDLAIGLATFLELKELSEPLLVLAQNGDLVASEAVLTISPDEGFEILLNQLEFAPAARQTALARLLSSTAAGSEKLLDAIEQGRASKELLRDSLVRQNMGEANTRLLALLKSLPNQSDEIPRLIESRRLGFVDAKGSFMAGKKIFDIQCAVCHSIDRHGGKLGPKLDGIHIRGVDRLLEDILNPNRNVDPAFSLTTIRTQEGANISGIGARTENGHIILTDPTGKTHRIPEESVAEKIHSSFSLMPAAFGSVIPENDLYDLLEFLLDKREKATSSKRKGPRRGSNRRPR